MSERKVGSVTYQEVDDEYFKERGLRRHAGVWSLWALGVGAVISGDFYGWNFGLATGGFGGLLIAGVLIAVMYYGLVLLHRRDVAGAPTHGRRVLVRSLGDGAVGRVPHRPGREHGVRDHAGRGRRGDRVLDAGDHRRLVRRHRRPLVEQPAVLVGRLLHHLRRDQHHRDRGHDAVHGDDHRPRRSRSWSSSSSRRIFSGKLDFSLLDQHPERRRRPIPGGGGSWFPFGISGIFKSLPFAIWFFLAIEEVPLAAEESMDPKSRRPQGDGLGDAHPADRGDPGRCSSTRRSRAEPSSTASRGSRCSTGLRDLRHGERGRAARAAVRDRAGGELLHDHLRLRPEHVLAVARRLLPAVPVEDARHDGRRRTSR